MVFGVGLLTARGAEAARPAPASSCDLTDRVVCTVSLSEKGRDPDWVALALFDCADNSSVGHYVSDSASKGDVFTVTSTSEGSPAFLTGWVRAGSRLTGIAYIEDRSLCTAAPAGSELEPATN